MDIRQLDPGFFASNQIAPDELPALAEKGFGSILVHRPDGEEPGQPDIATMREAATLAGLGFAAIPIRPGQADAAAVALFKEALAELPGPVVGYCRTGTRAATLWAMNQPDTLEHAVALAHKAGFDLSALTR